jgi:hypothetical protein
MSLKRRRAASGSGDDRDPFVHRPHEVTIDRASAICQSQSRFLVEDMACQRALLDADGRVARSSGLPSGCALI